ncbi:MAG: hypothetical protein WCJ64_27960 [Rhodospirillaceae bacterium]
MTDDTAGTQIGRLYQTLVQKEQPVTGLSDEARAERNDEIGRMVGSLVRLPAAGLNDVAAKLAVLCNRLRTEDCGVTSPHGALTALLAESARDDLGRLILRAGRADEVP